jgi:hypothetical protein
MITILGISGSLRKASFNSSLLKAAIELVPEGCKIEIGGINGIPLYNGDVEASEGIPAVVAQLKERIASADGLLLISPEYNNSIPGVFKNAIDWLSRPPEDIGRVFGNRPVGVIGASTPARSEPFYLRWLGSRCSELLGTRPWFGRTLYASNASNVFDESGKLIDQVTRNRVQGYLAGFIKFVRQAG